MWAIADYTPKWKTSHGTLINTCIVANCQSNTKLVAPKFDTIENIEANIGVKSTPENPLLLCAKHYIAVYRQLNLARPCASCGAMPKQDTYFARHSPNASLVYELMCDATGGEKMIHIKENDHICETCYRAQLAILRSVERKGSDSGTEEQLMDLIEIWKCKLACEDIKAVDYAIFHAVLYVANEILHLRAVLLPCVCNLFIAAYSANDEQDINLEVGEGTVKFTSRWLFYQHVQFITGKNCKGFLSYTSEENKHTGFLSFLRLVGCLYFKKHYSAVVSLTSIETPEQLLNSFPFGSDEEQHQKWYDKIRSIVSDRICSEDLLDSQNVAELNNEKPIQ